MKLLHVLRVELIPQSEIGGKNLDPHQVVPGHACLGKYSGEVLEEKIQFLFHLRRSYAGCGIDPDAPGDVERIVDENGIAERQIGGAVRKIDAATRNDWVRGGIRLKTEVYRYYGHLCQSGRPLYTLLATVSSDKATNLQRTRIEPIQPWPTFVMKAGHKSGLYGHPKLKGEATR